VKEPPEKSAEERVGSRELKEDALVELLAQDPSNVEPTVVLSGYLGRSTRPGHWRLYLDDSLTEFFDLHEAHILHSVQPSEGDPPATKTSLWVKVGVEIDHHRVQSRRIQADFLEGEFVTELDRSRADMIAMAAPGIIATTEPCIVTIYLTFTRCPNTLFGICSSFGGICRTPPGGPSSQSPSGCLSLNACP
jgi:hypothetical protein